MKTMNRFSKHLLIKYIHISLEIDDDDIYGVSVDLFPKCANFFFASIRFFFKARPNISAHTVEWLKTDTVCWYQ